MPRDLTPEEIDLFDKMAECSKAGSWEGMTLKQLQQLEAIGREVGHKNLWLQVDGAPRGKLTLEGEIATRLEMYKRARLALKCPPIEI
jgi:hypothetical protein